jgi:hypothetical protein
MGKRMNQYTIDALTILTSVVLSVFTAGFQVGTMKSEMRAMADRLSRIEGMFTLTLRNGKDDGKYL